MAVAEVFLSAFITVIVEKLASAALMKLARYEGILSQLEKCDNLLTMIRAVLVDAERKQITQEAVQLWLFNLQDLAYDFDDILDDLATEALRRQLTTKEFGASTSKVRKLIPTCCTRFSPSNLKYGYRISPKLEEITTRLQDLIEKKSILGLTENARSLTDRRGESLQTTSLVDESIIMGRETDKDALLKLVLNDETSSRNVSTISIVGMGGIGKTTLAQLVYNSKQVDALFDLMAWVCVSDDFDVFSITKKIFGHVADQDRCNFEDLDKLQVALKQTLSGKSFLIVLDDLWNENFQKWELLQLPFQGGARGSKIVVTTRNMGVVRTIGCDQEYYLKVLTDEESLSLFSVHATGTRNFDANPTLKLVGESIARKCQGLPLALKMLGRVLHQNTRVEDWTQLLNSEIWDLQGEKNVILPALRLSYHHLPQHLHKLFAYCSLFPKDYLFDTDELVLLWMAEGFLKHSDGNLTTKDLGRKCFEELVSRSFFQQSAKKESQYLMHDLTNDLATFVAGEFFFRLDDKMNGVDDNDEALKKLHHFSFVCQRYGVYRRYKALHRAKRLRTFLPVAITHGYSEFYLSNKVLIELLPQLQFLRVLSLKNYHIKEVPESIGGLKHLRYLNLSYTDITSLPEQVANLYNLQTLLLFGCRYLTKLPNNFAKLINLHHLDISDTPVLQKMPLGIGGLTSLQTLSKAIIGKSDGFKMFELKGLSNLRGRLLMKGLHNVINIMQAKEANLAGKSVDDLEMEWSDMFDDSRKEKIEFEVLEVLRPQDKLRKLGIVYYGGIKFPTWVGDRSFVALRQLTLRGCRSCTSLPSLGHLCSLQKLFVEDMEMVKTVGCELLGTGDSLSVIAFPSLEILEFRDMKGWELWSTNGSNNKEVFPCLRKLKIHGCPKLVEVSIQPVSSMRVLAIDGCSEAVLGSMVQVASSVTNLRVRNIVGLIQVQRGVIEFLKGVEELYIDDCKDLRWVWESEAEACKILVNLRRLKVSSCPELVSLGEKEEEEEEVNCLNNLTSLRELYLYNCSRLECFSEKRIEECGREGVIIFPNLERLSINSCSGMKWLPTGQKKLPSTLKALHVLSCENLCWWESGGEKSSGPLLNSMSSLEDILIDYWPKLKRLPELGGFIHLTSLSIDGCEGIESFPGKGFLPQGLRDLRISKCKNLKTFPEKGFLPQGLRELHIGYCKNLKWFPDDAELQILTSLVEMSIQNCPSMESAFPHGVWPPKLSKLGIGGLKKPVTEWGPQNFPTSLVELELYSESCLVSFVEAQEEEYVKGNSSSSNNPTTTMLLLLPSSLTSLEIWNCERLESLSKGLQHLTSLQQLQIWNCPKLRDLPDTLLPELSYLWIDNCPELEERCSSNSNRKDSYWPLISHIPCVYIYS